MDLMHMKKKILDFICRFFDRKSFNNLEFYGNEYKLPNIKPKDLVNDGYVLHSVTPD